MQLLSKVIYLTLFSFLVTVSVQAQNTTKLSATPDSTKKLIKVEASCGECQFHMEGKGCHLAIKMNGKTYFVDNAQIDSFGDAHAADGFCEAVRKAEVQGEIVNNRFKATYFKLVPLKKEDPHSGHGHE
jgi:hypothetical protein